MAEEVCWNMMAVHQLAELLLQGIEKVSINLTVLSDFNSVITVYKNDNYN